MYEVLTIILGIFGILQIILFFKLWGMTNDVEEIKKIISSTDGDSLNTAQVETLLGNYEAAYKIIKRCFILEAFKLYNDSDKVDFYYNENYEILVNKYQKYIDNLRGTYSIDYDKYNSIEKFQKLLSKD